MNELTKIIKSSIEDKGSITFAEFMEMALYHPTHGYYTKGLQRIGKEGDFYTSPHVHKSFGSVIGDFIIKSFDFNESDKLSIVEIGSGKGFLTLDILDHIKSENETYYELLNYYIVEKNSSSVNKSKQILEPHVDKLMWISDLYELDNAGLNGVVLSNELFDALPFHRLKVLDGQTAEAYVSLENDKLVENYDKPSCSDLEQYINSTNVRFAEGQEFEINLNAEKLLRQINNALQRGFILTIDYGFKAPELFSIDRMRGTYKCIYNHEINEKPYINIGEQDITSHVDFSNLIQVGENLGIKNVIYTTQGQFLVDWGILDLLNDIGVEKNIQAVKNLFLPEQMGDKFKVLIQEKNIKNMDGFYPKSPLKISFNVL